MHWLRRGLVRLSKRPSRVKPERHHAKVNTVTGKAPKPPTQLGRQRKLRRREISENARSKVRILANRCLTFLS
jgi:hypothetical protein